MANQSKLIRTTVRDTDAEKARIARMTASMFQNHKEFKEEMKQHFGEATGLGSSKWAIGPEKAWEPLPGGPRNLDADDNSICRTAPSNGSNLKHQLSRLGGLQNSRFATTTSDSTRNRVNSESSSRNSSLKANANVFTPAKSNSKTSSLSGSARSFTPKSLESSSPGRSGVQQVSSRAANYTAAVKQPNSQKEWEQMLLTDYEKRTGTVINPAPTKVEGVIEAVMAPILSSTASIKDVSVVPASEKLLEPMSKVETVEAAVASVSAPTVVVKNFVATKLNPQQSWEQIFANYQKQMSKVEPVAPIKVDITDSEKSAVNEELTVHEDSIDERSVVNEEPTINKEIAINKESINEDPVIMENPAVNEEFVVDEKPAVNEDAVADEKPVVNEEPANEVSIAESSTFTSMVAVSVSAPSITPIVDITADSVTAPSVTVVAENISVPGIAPTIAIAASSATAPSVDVTVEAISASPLTASNIADDTSSKVNASDPTNSITAGPSIMKEDQFIAMLLQEQHEKALKRSSIANSASSIKREDLKVNTPDAKSEISLPQMETYTHQTITSPNNKIVKPKSDLLYKGKLNFTTQTNNSYARTMSAQPLVPAPVNKWTTSKLTQGRSLSKVDEDFQTFLTNKAAPTATRARRQTVIKPLSPKQTKAEVNANIRKLAAGQAQFDAFLARRFASNPASPPPKQSINKTNTEAVTQNDAHALATQKSSKEVGQAIFAELKVESKDFVTSAPVIKKESAIKANACDEKVIGASTMVINKPSIAAGNLAVLKGESSQDKISHVAVNSSAPNEKEIDLQAGAQIINPFVDKPLKKKKQAASLASQDALWSISSFSDNGDKNNAVMDPKFKEGVRLTATQDARVVLADWDGSWCPPPVWEERGTFDSEYMTSYIQEWSDLVSPFQPIKNSVDVASEGFKSGKAVVNNFLLFKAPRHDTTIPDTLNSSSEKKRLNQTATSNAGIYLKKVEKFQRAQEHMITVESARHQEDLEMEPALNPYAPKIDIYLRPVTATDAKQILQIYNHYIAGSYIPEDQEPLTESDVEYLIECTTKDKLPFVVAVNGRAPAQSLNPKVKTKIPQYENVIGFGYTERRGCGIAGKITGRSRYTHNMHFYVHNDYLRKGVGSCILDRLLHVSSRAWSGHDGYDWINQNDDPSYGHGCGARCHQILVELPVLRKNDPNFAWMESFLRKFWFMEQFRLRSIGRSSVAHRAGEWLDVVCFQKEVEHEDEFTPFI